MAEQGPVKIQHFQTGPPPIYCSSVSGPTPRLGSRPDEMGVPVRIDSYSVTTTTPGTGSSITSMIVSSTGTTTCLGPFLGAFRAAVFGGRFFLTAGFGAALPARRTLDFACFGVVRFAAFLRAGLALALPRFELFLRVATRSVDHTGCGHARARGARRFQRALRQSDLLEPPGRRCGCWSTSPFLFRELLFADSGSGLSTPCSLSRISGCRDRGLYPLARPRAERHPLPAPIPFS